MSWLKRLLGREKRTETVELRELGLKVHADRRLEDRLTIVELLHLAIESGELSLKEGEEEPPGAELVEEIGSLMASPEPMDRIEGLRLKLQFLDRALRTAAIPWLRPGDRNAAAAVMQGWEGLYSKAKDVVESTASIIRRSDEGGLTQRYVDKSELVANLEGFLNVEVFSWGLLVADISYMGQDVWPSQAAVIYQPPMMAMGGGTFWDPSRGRKSGAGEHGGFPPEMESSVK